MIALNHRHIHFEVRIKDRADLHCNRGDNLDKAPSSYPCFVNDDDDCAVAREGVEGDGLRPGASEVHLAVAALGGNLDGGGMLSSVGANSGLHISDSHVCTVNKLFCQCLKGQGQRLVVEAVVAVARRTVLNVDKW